MDFSWSILINTYSCRSKDVKIEENLSYFLERLNVLYRHNWTAEAGKVLRQFELDVIRKAKTDGYDGQEATDDTEYQWDFSGSLLYSVTVITTIGKQSISQIIWSFTTTTKKVLILKMK